MITQEQLLNEIASAGFERPLADYCQKIAAHVITSKKKIFYYTDFLHACEIQKNEPEDLHNIQLCVNFLKSKRISLLRQEYRYEYDEVLYEVKTEDLQAAHESGTLFLDYLGFSDPNWKSRVYVVFVPSVEAAE